MPAGRRKRVSVGSEVNCQFDAAFNPEAESYFIGWSAIGFAPPFKDRLTMTFHTEAPGVASITANWSDAAGAHGQTFEYTISRPHEMSRC
jgi:hypothetical protein